jgi:hypothetical protein
MFKANIDKELRFRIDICSKDIIAKLLQALIDKSISIGARLLLPLATLHTSLALSAHLIKLTRLLRQGLVGGAVIYSVSIKLFCKIPVIGNALVT